MDERQPAEDIAAMGAPASPEALKEIVARHHRRRSRTLGVLLAVALIAGPVAGWAIGQGGGGGGQQLATGSNGGTPTAANAPADVANGGASSAGIAQPAFGKATHLFTRTTSDGITIRAYRMDPPTPPPSTPSTTTPPPGKAQTICPKPMPLEPPGPATGSGQAGASSGGTETKPAPPNTVVNGNPPSCAPGAPPICKAAPSVLAEVSNDAAVGQSFDPVDEKQPSDALSHVLGVLFGTAENSPALLVTVQTGPDVATVRLRLLDGGTDQMAPSNGIAVLARGSSGLLLEGSVVEALDASGKVLQSMPTQGGPKMGFACGVMVGPAGQPALRTYQAPVPATPPTTR